MSDPIPCPQRDRLTQEVLFAVQLIGKAKAQLDRAVDRGELASGHFETLVKAKTAARKATAALDTHRHEHGC